MPNSLLHNCKRSVIMCSSKKSVTFILLFIMKTIIIEQISFWGAVAGSAMLALNLSFSGWAFIPYLISNAASIYLLRNSNASKVITWQIYFFIAINFLGVARWLF